MQRRQFLGSAAAFAQGAQTRLPPADERANSSAGEVSYQVQVTIEGKRAGKPNKGKTLAAIQPHCDDIPIFAAGTVLKLIDEGYERMRAVIRTGELQLRPVLMTCVVAGVGLLPAAVSEGIGSQVQKPLAIVVVTGMMLAPIVILVTLPVLISVFSRRAR